MSCNFLVGICYCEIVIYYSLYTSVFHICVTRSYLEAMLEAK